MLHIVLHVAATMPYIHRHCHCMHSGCAHLHSTLTQNTQPVARTGCLNMLCTHLSYTSTLCVVTTAANNARCSTYTTTAAYCRCDSCTVIYNISCIELACTYHRCTIASYCVSFCIVYSATMRSLSYALCVYIL